MVANWVVDTFVRRTAIRNFPTFPRHEFILGLLVSLAGCDEPQTPLERLTLPAEPPLRLLERAGVVEGPDPAREGPLAVWSRDELLEWEHEIVGSGVRIRSPKLDGRLRDARVVRIRLRPGRASEVHVAALTTKDLTEVDRGRRMRVIDLDSAPRIRGSALVTIDLSDSIDADWGGAYSFGLSRLEIQLPDANPK